MNIDPAANNPIEILEYRCEMIGKFSELPQAVQCRKEVEEIIQRMQIMEQITYPQSLYFRKLLNNAS